MSLYIMEVQNLLQQLNNFDDLTFIDVTKWYKALNSEIIVQADEFGYKTDLATIAIMIVHLLRIC